MVESFVQSWIANEWETCIHQIIISAKPFRKIYTNDFQIFYIHSYK